MENEIEKRQQAIALYEAGHSVAEISQQLKRSATWVRKWVKRYKQEGAKGLKNRSSRPKRLAKSYDERTRQKVIAARLELVERAKGNQGLKYIGSQAIRTRLKEQELERVPSIATIERIIYAAGLSKRVEKEEPDRVVYPHLKPTHPHQLLQVDIVPHHLKGGEKIACFNGIDVVSKYPAGRSFRRKRSQDAADALLHIWREVGIPTYTQVDNEGCFSGGPTHPYVLGRVVRLALAVGTQLLFSPVSHPQSNGHVERFHQDYDRHVWDDTYLTHLESVNRQAHTFFHLYRHSGHQKSLQGLSPQVQHFQTRPHSLVMSHSFSKKKLPLYEGQVHFLRRVMPGSHVRVLNVDWPVPASQDRGVWVTLNIQKDGATLAIYDLAPDRPERVCLISHPFMLRETVIASNTDENTSSAEDAQPFVHATVIQEMADDFFQLGFDLVQKTLVWSLELTNSFIE